MSICIYIYTYKHFDLISNNCHLGLIVSIKPTSQTEQRKECTHISVEANVSDFFHFLTSCLYLMEQIATL